MDICTVNGPRRSTLDVGSPPKTKPVWLRIHVHSYPIAMTSVTPLAENNLGWEAKKSDTRRTGNAPIFISGAITSKWFASGSSRLPLSNVPRLVGRRRRPSPFAGRRIVKRVTVLRKLETPWPT